MFSTKVKKVKTNCFDDLMSKEFWFRFPKHRCKRDFSLEFLSQQIFSLSIDHEQHKRVRTFLDPTLFVVLVDLDRTLTKEKRRRWKTFKTKRKRKFLRRIFVRYRANYCELDISTFFHRIWTKKKQRWEISSLFFLLRLRSSTLWRREKDLNFDWNERFSVFVSVKKHRSIVSFDVTKRRKWNETKRNVDRFSLRYRSNRIHFNFANEIRIVIVLFLLFF